MAVARTITFRRTQAIDSRAQLAGHGVIGDGAMETAAPTHPHMQEGEAPHSKTDLSASWTHAYPHARETCSGTAETLRIGEIRVLEISVDNLTYIKLLFTRTMRW